MHDDMRTTIELDNDIAQQVRKLVKNTTLKQVSNDLLREALSGVIGGKKGHSKFTVKAKALGLLPGIDELSFNKLAGELDIEEFKHSNKK